MSRFLHQFDVQLHQGPRRIRRHKFSVAVFEQAGEFRALRANKDGYAANVKGKRVDGNQSRRRHNRFTTETTENKFRKTISRQGAKAYKHQSTCFLAPFAALRLCVKAFALPVDNPKSKIANHNSKLVILGSDTLYRDEGSAFSSQYRFFVACWLLRMTVLMGFSASCQPRSSQPQQELRTQFRPAENPGGKAVGHGPMRGEMSPAALDSRHPAQ
jgi:hypothetical protein